MASAILDDAVLKIPDPQTLRERLAQSIKQTQILRRYLKLSEQASRELGVNRPREAAR